MNKIPFIIVMVLFCSTVFAATIEVETSDKTPLADLPAKITVNDVTISTYIDRDNTIDLDGSGIAVIQVISDQIYTGRVDLDTETSVTLTPKAKISGYVKDDKDNLLLHARLAIVCSATTYAPLPTETDDIGSFTIEEVGFGECDIRAIEENRIASKTVVINESKHYVVNLEFGREQQGSNVWISLLIIALGIIIIIAVVVIVRKKRSSDFTSRQKDIMTTLNEREKEIVNMLYFSGKLTQSQLRHKSGLPKSSLHRTVTRLTEKNIIICKEEDGIQKVDLTDFFKDSWDKHSNEN